MGNGLGLDRRRCLEPRSLNGGEKFRVKPEVFECRHVIFPRGKPRLSGASAPHRFGSRPGLMVGLMPATVRRVAPRVIWELYSATALSGRLLDHPTPPGLLLLSGMPPVRKRLTRPLVGYRCISTPLHRKSTA